MTVKEVLERLKSLGDDARRKHNTKAGAPDNQFGVKLGDIRVIAKKIKTDHELALGLWDTGNVEAQLLATLIIKPSSLSADELDRMTRSTTCAQVAEWLNAYVVAQHPEKDALRERWMKDPGNPATPALESRAALRLRALASIRDHERGATPGGVRRCPDRSTNAMATGLLHGARRLGLLRGPEGDAGSSRGRARRSLLRDPSGRRSSGFQDMRANRKPSPEHARETRHDA